MNPFSGNPRFTIVQPSFSRGQKILRAFKHYKLQDWAAVEQVDSLTNIWNRSIKCDPRISEPEKAEIDRLIKAMVMIVKYPHSAVAQAGGTWRSH